MSFFKKTNLEDTLFQLKFTGKQLERFSKKAEKDQKLQQDKVKKALQQKNVEGARLYAENAIRKKNESLNYLRMASRLDAVQNRVQTAMTMQQMIKGIGNVTKDLEKAMSSMDLEKVDKIMSKFESQFEDLDVRSSTMESAMGNAMTLSAPEGQVNALIQEVAEANGLEIMDQLAEVDPARDTIGASSNPERQREDDLTKRLATLRQ